MNNDNDKFYCRTCQRETNHEILHDESESTLKDDNTKLWKSYELIRCKGCDTVSFHYSEVHTETSDPLSNCLTAISQYFPENYLFRDPIEGFQNLPKNIKAIYIEVLTSLNKNVPILTAIGLRALIEAICREKTYNWKNLYEGINDLGVNGILSLTQIDFLHACRFLGNVAAHEILAPTKDKLIASLDIIETLITTIYILPEKANSINKKDLVNGEFE